MNSVFSRLNLARFLALIQNYGDIPTKKQVPANRRMLVSLFHFNTQYEAGSPHTAHRYCIEAISPFLDCVQRNRWRVSIVMAGTCLEFLDNYHRQLFRSLQHLVNSGQVELLSSQYTPALWVAYPGMDLQKSVDLNRRLLERLHVNSRDIFCAHEILFGQGVKAVSDRFEAFVCRDDYLETMVRLEPNRPVYAMGSIPVIVASSHMLHSVTVGLAESPRIELDEHLDPRFRERLLWAVEKNTPKAFSARYGSTSDFEWAWYHCGSGHHFCSHASPEHASEFYWEPAWMNLHESVLLRLEENGWELTPVGDFFDHVKSIPRPQLPSVIEGPANFVESDGVAVWMGTHRSSWEDDPEILSRASRGRCVLVQCDHHVRKLKNGKSRRLCRAAIERLWEMQLRAEESDPLGWSPTGREVQHGLASGENLWTAVNRLERDLLGFQLRPREVLPPPGDGVHHRERRVVHCGMSIELVGIDERFCVSEGGGGVTVFEVLFRPKQPYFGVRIQNVDWRDVLYSPSGLEWEVMKLEERHLSQGFVYLPLANGLLGIGQGRYIIKDNRWIHLAAKVCTETGSVSLGVRSITVPARRYYWRIFYFEGELKEALCLANRVNWSVYPEELPGL